MWGWGWRWVITDASVACWPPARSASNLCPIPVSVLCPEPITQHHTCMQALCSAASFSHASRALFPPPQRSTFVS